MANIHFWYESANHLCGIFGSVLRDGNVVQNIISGLKKLEYRGYDSIGVAVIKDNELSIRKDMGRIEDVVND